MIATSLRENIQRDNKHLLIPWHSFIMFRIRFLGPNRHEGGGENYALSLIRKEIREKADHRYLFFASKGVCVQCLFACTLFSAVCWLVHTQTTAFLPYISMDSHILRDMQRRYVCICLTNSHDPGTPSLDNRALLPRNKGRVSGASPGEPPRPPGAQSWQWLAGMAAH